jgi:hypothetical protein
MPLLDSPLVPDELEVLPELVVPELVVPELVVPELLLVGDPEVHPATASVVVNA